MRVRVKTQKNIYSKGDVQTLSKHIYLIVEHKGKMSKLKNLNTGETLKRIYHDEELSHTFTQTEVTEVVKKKLVKDKPKIN